MKEQGPSLEYLTHRLSECPEEFLMEPVIEAAGVIHVDAVVSDLRRDLGGGLLTEQEATRFRPEGPKSRNHLTLILVAAWLLHDTWFRERKWFAQAGYEWLSNGLENLAK